ncbi:class I SAM-dependent methyltransferase [Mycobacterium sp. CPCC 205372]|uniref:Class I SAM-dependent methyltransferase n=1 Tax=Mycobacterium hippophais TaxID=3016340 RepID=A0ABT4PRF0_9MYCO|nr:class I SAM-dependent methyltransferase [Mycobacterium hippophais]MCZ8379126.1 class I SAM-dependent methyltransferase [Mycobacterium hippophais]
MDHADGGVSVHNASDFERPVSTWQDIPGWFTWRGGQEEAVAHFGDGSRFVEVGCYLGKSLCSLAEVVRGSGRDIAVTGVDTGRGSGPEGVSEINAHGAAVEFGGGTFAGLLHRNLIACGAADLVQLLITDSVAAAALFADESLAWVHLDARHDYDSVRADIAAWLPKVRPGGWLSGDDYNRDWFPGVVDAVGDTLPGAEVWCSTQWRWLKP